MTLEERERRIEEAEAILVVRAAELEERARDLDKREAALREAGG